VPTHSKSSESCFVVRSSLSFEKNAKCRPRTLATATSCAPTVATSLCFSKAVPSALRAKTGERVRHPVSRVT